MSRLSVALTIAALVVVQAAYAGDSGYKLLKLGGHAVKWGAPEFGQGAVVTWRLAFDQGEAPGRENCRRTSGLDGLLQRSGLGREDALRAADAAFSLWSEAANVRFLPAAAGEPADITITAEAENDGIAYTDVTPGAVSGEHVTSLSRALVCLNPYAEWTTTASGTYRLAYVLAHEIGHAIGLDHPSPTGSLMSFEYEAVRDGLGPGDMAGAVRLYGPAARAISTR